MRYLLAASAALLLFALPSRACHSGLHLIPTTDTVPAGEYAAEVELAGALDGSAAIGMNAAVEFGADHGDWLAEWGLDSAFAPGDKSTVALNAKGVLSTSGRSSLAIGLSDLRAGTPVRFFAVSSRDLPGYRGHVGFLTSSGTVRWFLGADRALSDALTAMADTISGPENAASVALAWSLTSSSGMSLAVEFPNAGGDPTAALCFEVARS
jgi:hypothetical protein